jgi:glycolate oxidase FAD binding subunit
MTTLDQAQALADAVRDAAARGTPLAIRGHGTKQFLTGQPAGTPLDITGHRGIVSYEPTELVLTARAGTPLAEIEQALAAQNQMLGFEPPHYGTNATLGGTIACGLSGPRRPFAGAARDFVLGTRIINGRGEILKFGGQVMKNVAGFDVSRLMAGSHGSLGVLLEVSLKVLPKPPGEITLGFEMPADRAIHTMNSWAGQPLPLSAAAHSGDTLYIRLSGTETGIRAARTRLGGEPLDAGTTFWEELREHRRAFFQDARPLWRLSVPSASAPLAIPGHWILDWGGAQRWLKSEAPAADITRTAQAAGGTARRFGPVTTRDSALPQTLEKLNVAVRAAFDPQRVFAAATALR